ncbi:MAG: hypothetical protein ACE5FH_07925 [Candidatus Zixiibacteriota bacterium]
MKRIVSASIMLSLILMFSLLIMAFLAGSAFAAKEQVARRPVNPLINKAVTYAIPFSGGAYEANLKQKGSAPPMSLASPPGPGPGMEMGTTWYDKQRNGSMRRMIAIGEHDNGGTPNPMVHSVWMHLPAPDFDDRTFMYSAYDALSGTFTLSKPVQPISEYAGYCVADVTSDNRAYLSGHNNTGGGNQVHCYWDFAPAFASFSQSRIPDSVAEAGGAVGQSTIWPASMYQEGTANVTHVIAQVSNPGAGDPQPIYYFRKVGTDETGEWDAIPYIIDTVYDLAQDLYASKISDKVVLGWVANLPKPGDCDTCSNNDGATFVQLDNDAYVQVSLDQGQSWLPRINVTKNVDGEAGFRPYTDLSVLLTSDDTWHLLYSGRVWPADANTGGAAGRLACKLFHTSEFVNGLGEAPRVAHDADWDQTKCNGGSWQMNLSKMTLSECDGKLYALFSMFNDVGGTGIGDDCAARADDGDPVGSANSELWITVSGDQGVTWDQSRNLTNSYRPGCDSASGTGGECGSEHYSSMAPNGRLNLASDDWSNAETVDPSGSYSGDYYLDVQYIQDPDPGGIVSDEGTWQNASLKWFRLACVEPDPNPELSLTPNVIGYPAWGKHGVEIDTMLTIENTGNVGIVYSTSIIELTGSGWLGLVGFNGTVSSGFNNTVNGTITMNTGGVVNIPGTIVYLHGLVVFTSNAQSSPDTMEIEYWVADTLVAPEWDTVSTDRLGLIVSKTGNMGKQGAGKVNMDYVDIGGDCDTNATVYLYDGSPVIGWIEGGVDTQFNWSIFGSSYLDTNGFIPISHMRMDTCDAEIFRARFITRDTALCIEKYWFAPYDPDSDIFIIQCLKIYHYPATPQPAKVVTIGEAWDWDIPADTGVDNASGFDPVKNLIWQQGGEYNQDDTTECQENDARFGGVRFIKSVEADGSEATFPYGAYTLDNATYVYPNDGFSETELYDNMINKPGWTTFSSTHPDSQLVDLHMVMTYSAEKTLNYGDTLTYYLALVTQENGTEADFKTASDMAVAWYNGHVAYNVCTNGDDCCDGYGTRGDVNSDGSELDITCVVDFLFGSGCTMPCPDDADVNGDGAVADIVDLTFIVDWLFGVPPILVPCS